MKVIRLSLFLVPLFLVWLAGFGLFIYRIPQDVTDNTTLTDAIVVLTGRKGRVQLGFHLIQQGLAKKLFISGVHPTVKLPALLNQQHLEGLDYPHDLGTNLGYQAQNTRGNALETQQWVYQNHIKSVRLVTSNYHMIRSLMLFRRQLPNTFIIAHPIIEKQEWSWQSLATLGSEYHKFLRDLIFK